MADYYTPGTPATANTLARAESIAAELVTIKASFDKIPEQLSLEQDRAAYALDTGVADAYLVALPATLLAYTTGLSVRMKAVNANTGPSTLNVDGLGVKPIKRSNGDALTAGDIPAGSVFEYHFDGTNFQIPTGAVTSTVAIADGGTGATTAGGARTNLGVAIGSDVQAFDAVLDDLAALAVVADNEVIVGTGAGTYAHESGATLRTSLGLAIGTDVQADLDVPSQAEAEAGTATTERVWTAERVKQAIAALVGGVNVQTFPADGTWTKPAGATRVHVQVWSGAASGPNATTAGDEAAGAGGGGYDDAWFDASDLGATEVITVATGGAAVTTDNTDGNAGGQSSFGSLVVVNGASAPGRAANSVLGGNGGGVQIGAEDFSGGNGTNGSGALGKSVKRGGAAGGGTNGAVTFAGGSSEDGGAGAGSVSSSTIGAPGTSLRAGDAGAGNNAGNATAGSIPSGAGGSAQGTGNDSGAGGRGEIIVTTWL